MLRRIEHFHNLHLYLFWRAGRGSDETCFHSDRRGRPRRIDLDAQKIVRLRDLEKSRWRKIADC